MLRTKDDLGPMLTLLLIAFRGKERLKSPDIIKLSSTFHGTRKDILLKVWGDDSFFNSRNLDVYITKLRDMLKEDSRIEIITIKSVGYHFATV
jgi:hypothetical protein